MWVQTINIECTTQVCIKGQKESYFEGNITNLVFKRMVIDLSEYVWVAFKYRPEIKLTLLKVNIFTCSLLKHFKT